MGGKSSKGRKNESVLRAARQSIQQSSFGKEFKSLPTTVDTNELLSGPRAQPLIRVLRQGDAIGFGKLISGSKFSVNECLDTPKMAPIHLAVLLRSEPALRGLQNIPSLDINITNRDGDTPLILLLKTCGTEAEATSMAACIINDSRCNMQLKNRNGATALCIAAAKGFENITRLLVSGGRIQKYSHGSLAMTFKFALMLDQEHLIETIFKSMSEKYQSEFMNFFSKEGPEYYQVAQLLQESGYIDDVEPVVPPRLTISQENLSIFAARCTMVGTPEYFTQQKTVDANGHDLFVGNLVQIMSEDVIRKVNPKLDEDDDDFIEGVAEQEAFIHDIDDDGDLYVDTTGTPYSGYISSKAVTFISQGPRGEIGDGTKVGVGYLVKVDPDEEEVMNLAKGHGGWKPEFKACCGRTGRVRKIDRAGDMYVYFSWGARVCFNPMALMVSSSDEVEAKDFDGNWLKKGAYARVTSDKAEFTALQEEIGAPSDGKYIDIMGKLVTIHRLRIFLQFTHAIARHGKISFNLNPSCLRLVSSAKDSNGNDIKIGDVVTVLNEVEKVKTLQTAKYGDWSEKMAAVIGSSGVVVDVDVNPGTRESVAQVQFADGSFYMNPRVLRTSSGSVRKGSLQPRDTGYDSTGTTGTMGRSAGGLMSPRKSETGSNHSTRSIERHGSIGLDPNEGLQIILREDLVIGRKIGEGGFGQVSIGSWRGTDCAIKQIRSIVTSGIEYSELLQEAKIQYSLKHPNIVQLYGISYVEDLWMVMQYIQGIDLFDLLFGDDGSKVVIPAASRRIQFSSKLKIATQTTNALSYLHEKGYIHNDLKPENIIIEKRSGNVYVCDFGITQFLGDTSIQTFTAKYTSSFGGTLPYIAPECFDKDETKKKYRRPTFKSDVWAIGAIFSELFAQVQLFPDDKEIYKCKLMKDFSCVKKFVKGLPINVRPILQKALDANPDQRPTCKEMNTFFFDVSRSGGVVTVVHK